MSAPERPPRVLDEGRDTGDPGDGSREPAADNSFADARKQAREDRPPVVKMDGSGDGDDFGNRMEED